MKAVVAARPGGTEVLELRDLPLPEPGPGEVRVRLRAAALNRLDLWVRRNLPAERYPVVLGCEGAGEVEALGSGVSGPVPGREVIVAPGDGCGACPECASGRESYCARYTMLGYQRDGTYAEAVVVPAACAVPKPEALSWVEAAAFPLTSLTAWHMLFERGRLRAGDEVLVMAAGSGVGQAAVQIARLAGARVLATAGTEAKRRKASELGADVVVDYTRDGWHREVREATGGRGVDLVVDHTGSRFWDEVVRTLATGGRLVLCGATSGWDVDLDLRFLFVRQQSVLGSYMGSKGELARALRMAARGSLVPVVDRTFPLEEARAAQELLESRSQFGKVVLLVGGASAVTSPPGSGG